MNNSTIKWLYKVPGRKKAYIVFLILAQAVHGASGVLYALLLRGVVDAAAGGQRHDFWMYIILLTALVCFQLAIRAVIRWLKELANASFENIFKQRLLDVILHKDFASISAVHSGEWMNRLTNDTKVVAGSYVDILPGLSGMVVKLVSALVMIIVIEPKFAAILIPGGALMIVCTWGFRKVLKKMHRNVQEADGRLRIFLQERIGSLMMIRSFAAEERTSEAAEEKLSDHLAARMIRTRFSNFCNIGFGAAMSGMYLLGIGWCGYGILKGTITFGTLTAITQLITQIQTPFANITGYIPRYYSMIASAERLIEAESFEGDTSLKAMDLKHICSFYHDRLRSVGMYGVCFTYYPPAEKIEQFSKAAMPVAIEDISMEIMKGEHIALCGISGSGKSTILKLLMSVYAPDKGMRFYTEQSGKENTSSEERLELTSDFRRLFAYVPQGNFLMNGTIREIVSFADPQAAYDEERLTRALRIACADNFVDALDKGADTLLGERGTGLSEGQMQRIAIARAIFSESPILLLDEATSALDEATEEALLSNLRSMTDLTVIIVTHRPAALKICDRVLQLDQTGVSAI